MSEFAGTTYIICIIDKSESMGVVRDETISGFNAYLHDRQAEDTGKTKLTLTLFNTTCETPVVAESVGAVADLDQSRYQPEGFTALNDAIMASLAKAESLVQADDRALVCIVTDGQENSSKEATKSQVRARIEELQNRGNWTFTYLSAGPSAFADASGIGIAAGNTSAYDASQPAAAFARMSSNTRMYSEGAAARSTSFYDQQDPPQTGTAMPSPGIPTPTAGPQPQTTWTKTPAEGLPKTTTSWLKP